MDAIVVGILIAVIIAFIAVRIMISQMKPVSRKYEAAQYTKPEDVRYQVREDVYLRTDVTRRQIQRSQGGTGSGPVSGAGGMPTGGVINLSGPAGGPGGRSGGPAPHAGGRPGGRR